MPLDSEPSPAATSFPRENARTQRYTLGRPRSFSVSPDGTHVLFVRSPAGDVRSGQLWRMAADTGRERLLIDPVQALGSDVEELSPQERARRERLRESAAGVVAYSTDDDHTLACCALSSRLFVVSLTEDNGSPRAWEVQTPGPVVDPRLDPTGRWIAYTSGGSLHVVGTDGSDACALAVPDRETETWGSADFVAAEEFDRPRGFWWSPAGGQLLVEHVDEAPVDTWWVSDPARPDQAPRPQRYPAAGTPNARVALWLVDLEGSRTAVTWDAAYEYLAAVHWSPHGPPLLQVLDRHQRRAEILTVDVGSGVTSALREQHDPHWVDVVPGVPAWLPGGRLLTVEVSGDRYALCVDGQAVTPPGMQVRGVSAVADDPAEGVLLTASDEPSEQQLWRWTDDGLLALTDEPGVHAGTARAGTAVTVSATLDRPLPVARVHRAGAHRVVESRATVPSLIPNVRRHSTPAQDIRCVTLLPTGWVEGSGLLPVLLDPYGGPHAQRVLAAQGAYRESQWFADQGFAVVVADGRGTPRSPAWEREVHHDLAGPALADQVEALLAAAARFPDLDLTRVAIRGWSFGGYLAALAVLRRPDVFHAAIAGAPVTDWRLYDTGYTERYLGLPQEHPDSYERASLLTGAGSLSRPLLLVHGLADDNVFVAHTLQLSARLTAAGRAHTVLPLSGVTHMASQEEVAENLLLLQVDFLRRALAGAGSRAPG